MGVWDALKRVFGGGDGHAQQEPWPGMGPGSAVSPGKAVELLRQTGFAHLAPQLEPMMRTAIKLTPSAVEADALAIGASRLGGPADLPPGVEWPRWERGPLALLAQLRLADLTEHDREHVLPETGSLAVFYDAVEQPWGMEPGDDQAWRVLYFEDESTLTRMQPPDDLDDWARFAPHSVQAQAVASFPSWQTLSEFSALEFADDAEEEYYMEWLASIIGGEFSEETYLLGWPQEIQGDVHAELVFYGARGKGGPVEPGLPKDWRLLLQVDTMRSPEWMWGDAGRLYLMIRTEDLAARRFEKTWTTLQCY